MTPDQLAALLAGNPVETIFRGPRCPARGESYPVMMQEPTDVRAIVTGSKLRPRCKRAWTLGAVVDRSEPVFLLNAESKGGVIVPLDGKRSEDEPQAHGYVDHPGVQVLDAGAAVDPQLVETFAESQRAAARFAAEKVDKLAKRRARSLSNRVHNALMQARVHGVEPDVEALEGWLESVEQAAREAA